MRQNSQTSRRRNRETTNDRLRKRIRQPLSNTSQMFKLIVRKIRLRLKIPNGQTSEKCSRCTKSANLNKGSKPIPNNASQTPDSMSGKPSRRLRVRSDPISMILNREPNNANITQRCRPILNNAIQTPNQISSKPSLRVRSQDDLIHVRKNRDSISAHPSNSTSQTSNLNTRKHTQRLMTQIGLLKISSQNTTFASASQGCMPHLLSNANQNTNLICARTTSFQMCSSTSPSLNSSCPQISLRPDRLRSSLWRRTAQAVTCKRTWTRTSARSVDLASAI